MVKNIGYGLLLAWLLSACSLNIGGGRESSLGVAPRKISPVVYVYPTTDVYQEATVGVLPFQVPANFAPEQGMALAALFKDVLLGKRIFPVVRQLHIPYGDLDDALAAGRKAGVDLVLAGRLSRALDATEMGGARAAVSVRLLNVHSGATVWYIEQAADQPVDQQDMSFWGRFRDSFSGPEVRPSRGAPALPNLLSLIAQDMAEVMRGARVVRR